MEDSTRLRMEDSIGDAPVCFVHTERVPGQCGVVLGGLVKGTKDYHQSWN